MSWIGTEIPTEETQMSMESTSDYSQDETLNKFQEKEHLHS